MPQYSKKSYSQFRTLVYSISAIIMYPRFLQTKRGFLIIGIAVLIFCCFRGASASCGQGPSNKVRACPYTPPGLQLTRGVPGHCPVGTDLIGDCITDDDCFLKKLGNVCCYNRCRGITECHRFP